LKLDRAIESLTRTGKIVIKKLLVQILSNLSGFNLTFLNTARKSSLKAREALSVYR
jgi:hypothetical protein